MLKGVLGGGGGGDGGGQPRRQRPLNSAGQLAAVHELPRRPIRLAHSASTHYFGVCRSSKVGATS